MPDAPGLRFAFRIVANVAPPLPLERSGADLLEFIPITGGPVTGEVAGEIIPGGGDWCLTRADESYHVEARYLIRTDDGAVIDVVNVGVLRHLAGDAGSPDRMGYFLTTPRFRTTSDELQWLTRSVFVGQATVHETDTTIDIYEVTT